MRIIFLGTGTSMGVPVIACNCRTCQSRDVHDNRLRTSAIIQTDAGHNILIDIGPDFRQQMLRCGITHLDAILITHPHRDHVGGLDDVRPLNYMQQCNMQVYGNSLTCFALRRDYGYIFGKHEYPGLPEVDLHEVDGETPFLAAGEMVVPIKAMHKDMPILGYRIGSIAYMTDANKIEPKELDKLIGVDVLVINALRREKHFSHFSVPEALAVIDKVRPRRAFLTHISHEMGLHEEVDVTLPDNVKLAYDCLEVEVE